MRQTCISLLNVGNKETTAVWPQLLRLLQIEVGFSLYSPQSHSDPLDPPEI